MAQAAPVLEPWELSTRGHYVKSMTRVHDNPQTAIKDIWANGKDAGATELRVVGRMIGNITTLITADNGPGPRDMNPNSPDYRNITHASFLGIMDLGYTTALDNHLAIGQFGSAASTAPLRLGKDVVIATRTPSFFYCALLSASLISEDPQRRGMQVPYLVCEINSGQWHENTDGSFAAFAAHTPFGDGSADDCAKLLEV